jgi:hypothetical protein
MPTDLEKQILNSLRSLTSADRPATFNDLARQFGTTAPLIASLAHQMVDKGLAQPSYVTIKGVQKMYGLLPQPAAAVGS